MRLKKRTCPAIPLGKTEEQEQKRKKKEKESGEFGEPSRVPCNPNKDMALRKGGGSPRKAGLSKKKFLEPVCEHFPITQLG